MLLYSVEEWRLQEADFSKLHYLHSSFMMLNKKIHGPHLMEGMRDKEYQEAVIQVKLRKILMQLH